MIPGDPAANILGIEATKEAVEALREELGLNLPLHEQYVIFMKNTLRGEFGNSLVTKVPIAKELPRRLTNTFYLALGGTIVAILLGIIIGVVSAIKQNSFTDNFLMVISLVSVSMPSYFLALIMILIFSLQLKMFPSTGLTTPRHYILPIITLGLESVGFVARMTRSAMLNVIRQDYIRTAKAKGVSSFFVIFTHAFRNALVTVITVIGLRFGGLLAGSALIESVFSIPGIGKYMVDGVLTRDYPVVQITVLTIATIFVVVNMLVDILYMFVDPRIKY
jgi:ABC-type dipeptide/oligopeptide/nickel transport system permease component